MKGLAVVRSVVMCGLLVVGAAGGASAQECLASSQFGSGTFSGCTGVPITFTTCLFAGEFSLANGLLAGNQYTFTSTGGTGNWITVQEVATSQVIDSGSSPLTVVVPNDGSYRVHVHVNGPPTCGTESSCRTVSGVCNPNPPPNIDVTPLNFDATQAADTVTTQTLTIANTGSLDLIWEIEEDPGAAPTGYPTELTGSPSRLGVAPPVERGTAPPRSLRSLLFAEVVQDGGFEVGSPNPYWDEASTNFGSPLCTVAACGTGTGTGPRGGDWWVWFGGITGPFEAGSVSQSVTIAPGGPATLSFWVEQFVCSGSADDFLEVTLGGTLLWSTSAAAPECGTLGYRQVTADVSAFADGVPRVLEFYGETLGTAGTNFFVDDVSLVDSSVAPCDNPGDVSWLSVSPASGTTAGASSSPVTVTFDSTGLAPDTYFAHLCVASNDPDLGPGNGTNLVVVPVSLEVEAPVVAVVTVEVGPLGGGTVAGGGPYDIGALATVQAFPAPGWVFVHWLVDGDEVIDNPYTFEVTANITLTAIFERQPVNAIPAASTLGLVLLLGLLAGAGVFVLRRRLA